MERTDVDFLAVSIGTVQGRAKKRPKLDWPRLRQLNDALGIPLTVYDGSGLKDDQFRRLIANGVAKIGYSTALANAALEQVQASAKDSTQRCYVDAMRAVQDAVEQESERCLRLWGAAGRAAEVLQRCRHWTLVEHVVTCDGEELDHDEVAGVLLEGRRVLGAIPGVRAVSPGSAARADGACRYSWCVRFCHSAAVDSYREHPAYADFAARQSRPGWRASAGSHCVSPGARGVHEYEAQFASASTHGAGT